MARKQTPDPPELRFALGDPSVDTTSIDSAALNMEAKAFFIRKGRTDGRRDLGLASLEMEIRQVLADLDLGGKVVVEKDRQ